MRVSRSYTLLASIDAAIDAGRARNDVVPRRGDSIHFRAAIAGAPLLR